MEEYKIKPTPSIQLWIVVSGRIVYSDFIEEEQVFQGSISDCYAWVKCKQEGLFKI